MDIHLVENIVAIADERSITKAAEKRFVTQSALNQQLQKLEEELGTPLFFRSRGNWQPTEAGRIYLDCARKMIAMKKEAYIRIGDISQRNQQRITMGLIPERGIDMFTAVYPKFHSAFPQVMLEPVECSVTEMQRMISMGQLDLGLATLTPGQRDANSYITLGQEEIVLAVPVKNPLAKGSSASPVHAPEVELSRFANEPFVRIYQKSTMSQVTDDLFQQAGFQPNVLFATASNLSKFRIVALGLGCALLPRFYARENPGVVYFRLPGHPSWDVTICTMKGAYLGRAEESYIALCRQFWQEKLGE